MYVLDDLSYAQIGQRLRIRRQTAAQYVRSENERRAIENQDQREIETAKSIEVYSRVIRWNVFRMEQPGATGWESRNIIAARTRIDQLLGLDAAVKIRIRDETPPPARSAGGPGVTELLRLAISLAPTNPMPWEGQPC